MDNLLLLDIDGTLFDPEVFGKKIRNRFCEVLKISEDELARANADYYSRLETTTDFNPRDITVFIAQRFNSDPNLLDKIFWEEDSIYEESLYEETAEALVKMSKTFTLGIYSQGFKELQQRKLIASGISRYFTPQYMFFHRRKTSDEAIALLPDKATVIDDSHDVVSRIAPYVAAVWMNRRSSDSDPEIKTIHNLLEFAS